MTRRPSTAIGRKASGAHGSSTSTPRTASSGTPAMEDRRSIFVLGSLMVAEERITTKFSGLVGADASEEEVTFLSTQQVDEARHMQFYARFQDEVVAEPALIAAHVERARAQVSTAFQTIFDDKLPSRRTIVCSPTPPTAARRPAFVTIYHLILEATLGLTTFEFATGFMNREGLLPRVLSRATARSTTTSTATSAMASGSRAKPSPRTKQWARSSARHCATCSPQSPSP